MLFRNLTQRFYPSSDTPIDAYFDTQVDVAVYRNLASKIFAGSHVFPNFARPKTLGAKSKNKREQKAMNNKKKIIGICGSASRNSGNLSILKFISESEKSEFDFEIIEDLTGFPHFKTELTDENVPEKIADFRNKILNADGVIICTPEYVFSIPSGLKNILEWCVSTTVFSDKPVGLITASASGEKGHAELKLIMKTIQTDFTDGSTLLIQGIKGKVSKDGEIKDENTRIELQKLIESFKGLIKASS